MNRNTFLHGLIVAAVLAFASAATIASIAPWTGMSAIVRVAIPMIAFAYVVYVVRASSVKTGVLTTCSLWSVLAVIAWWVAPPLPAYLLIHVGAIWLVRSLYTYSGIVPALTDLVLSGLATAGLVWSLSRTGSVFLGVWTFFLVQALYVFIPRSVRQVTSPTNYSFDSARRQADAALQQLIGGTQS